MKRLFVTAAVVVCVCAAALFARSETQTRTIYVSAVDAKGVPVADLTAGDLRVSEGGRAQTPLKVEHASAPMRIAVVVDDGGLGLPEVRRGLTGLVEALQGHAEVGVFSTAHSEATVTNFTPDTKVLVEAIQGLVPIKVGFGDPLGGPLGSLTGELARQFEAQAPARPVLLVLTIGRLCHYASYTQPLSGYLAQDAAAGSVQATTLTQQGCPDGPISQGSILGQVQRSGATYVAVAVAHSGLVSGPNDAYAKVSGGRIDRVLSDSAIPEALARIATDLLGQYAVTYNSSPVPKQGVRLRVEVKRAGVTVRAPERVGVR